jgi:hypothetical protein
LVKGVARYVNTESVAVMKILIKIYFCFYNVLRNSIAAGVLSFFGLLLSPMIAAHWQ